MLNSTSLLTTKIVRDLQLLRIDFGAQPSYMTKFNDPEAVWLGVQGGARADCSKLITGAVVREMVPALSFLPVIYSLAGLLHWVRNTDLNNEHGAVYALRRVLLHIAQSSFLNAIRMKDLIIIEKLIRFSKGRMDWKPDICRSSTIEKDVVRGINACLERRPTNGHIEMGQDIHPFSIDIMLPPYIQDCLNRSFPLESKQETSSSCTRPQHDNNNADIHFEERLVRPFRRKLQNLHG